MSWTLSTVVRKARATVQRMSRASIFQVWLLPMSAGLAHVKVLRVAPFLIEHVVWGGLLS